MQKEWIINNSEMSEKSLIERLLAIRGITKKQDIKDFLNPLEIKLTEPSAFLDIKTAVERIVKAIEIQEKILIYGDFDADGVTSTSLLIKTLKYLNANVDYYIPDRENEGHGLNSKTLVKLMTSKKPKLIITVDCGISNLEEVKFINSFKIDVIITDHHEAPEKLPPAIAIIDPKAPNSLDESLSAKKINELTSLAGVGVAFKLAQALLQHYEKTEFVYEILPFVALGTIADIVPLIGENRYYVAKGLELISNGKHYGIKRLLEEAGYKVENGITAEQIAFGAAPRINASGRLDTVESALKVMISDNKQEIEMAIVSLNNLNKVRQELCSQTFAQACNMLEEQSNNDNTIILFNPDWHIGIIGIVASQLVEKYYKPVFLMTYHAESKQFRCSARSIKGIHLYETIEVNSEKLDGFGGHEMAAGLSFSEDNITYEELKTALNKTVDEILGGKKLHPVLNIDLEIKADELDVKMIDDISKLEPFGASNPAPIFACNNLTLKEKKLMGSNKDHLKLVVQEGDYTYDCIWWSKGDISLISGDKLDIAFAPQINTYNGNTSLQLILQDVHSEYLKDDDVEKNDEIKVFDHRRKTGILQQVDDYVKSSKLDIVIFAEDKFIVEKLAPFKTLSEKIITRQTIRNADSVMFFDYPPNEEIFNEIITKIKPKTIHMMNYEAPQVDETSLLKTFSGMIKFVCNNKDGNFDLNSSASFLALTKNFCLTLLEIFEECDMIKILQKDEDTCKINFSNNIEISKVLHTTKYQDLAEILEQINAYRAELLEDTIKI